MPAKIYTRHPMTFSCIYQTRPSLASLGRSPYHTAIHTDHPMAFSCLYEKHPSLPSLGGCPDQTAIHTCHPMAYSCLHQTSPSLSSLVIRIWPGLYCHGYLQHNSWLWMAQDQIRCSSSKINMRLTNP